MPRRSADVRKRAAFDILSSWYPLAWPAAIAALSVFGLPGCAHSKKTEVPSKILCPGIELRGEIQPGLSDVEKRLVCGDEEVGNKIGGAWKEIPVSQMKFHLTTFLQDRALYHAQFSQQGDRIVVELGEPTRVTQLTATGAPESLMLDRKRGVIGEKLTPNLLTVVEQWVVQRLQAQGFACPRVRAEGNPDTGVITAEVETGARSNIVSILEDPLKGVREGMFRRYDAFRMGQPYQGDWVTLTERRILSQGLVQGIHFTTFCEPQGAVLKQEIVPGAPRLLSFGVGANTEGLLLLKTSWRNTRFGSSASLIDVTAQASTLLQQLSASMVWYFRDVPSRQYLKPLFELKHQNERTFQTISQRFQVSPGTSRDTRDWAFAVRSGPTYDVIRTLRGEGPRTSHFLSLETELRAGSHDFEFYRTSPRTGFDSTLTAGLNDKTLFSDVSAQRLRLQAESLWNYRDYDPPLVVIGLRTGAATTITPERVGASTLLPPNFRQFLGGSLNLRGFARNELPGDDDGGLTSVYGGLELRLGTLLPFGFQPFTFVDAGALGRTPLELDSPLFWSPGVGVRWESPVGTLRTTLAHGYVSGTGLSAEAERDLSHLQFYFSFGEEF